MANAKRLNKFRSLQCRECGSRDLKATSSQQMLVVRGRKQLTAEIICNACGHSWWSASRLGRLLARQEDAKRKCAMGHSGKKETRRVVGYTARRIVKAGSEQPLNPQKAELAVE